MFWASLNNTLSRRRVRLRGERRFVAVLAVVVFTLVAAGPLFASITLVEAVNAALEQSPRVLIQKETVKSMEGDLTDARSVFDPQFSLSTQYRKDMPSLASGIDQNTLTTTLSASRLLLPGITIRPEISITGVAESAESGSAGSNQSSAGITFTIPLMEGLGENLSRSALSAAEKNYQAAGYDLQQMVSKSIYTAAVTYWNYVYAYRKLALDHEQRLSADEQLRATQALAAADEIASIRIEQARAYLQQAESTEVSSALLLRQSWNELLLAMGCSTSGREETEKPDDNYPVPDHSLLESLADVSRLQRWAERFRPDLHSLRLQGEAADDLLRGYRNTLKPKVDLGLWAGYVGENSGSTLRQYVASPGGNILQKSVSATLTYSFTSGNHADEAAYIRSRASREKSMISIQELERTIASTVAVAVETVRNTAAVLTLSRRSTDSYRMLKNGELKKFRMGMSDIFNLETISNSLASAELQLLAAEKAYAVAVLDLRLAVGALIRVQKSVMSVEREDLVSIPFFEKSGMKP